MDPVGVNLELRDKRGRTALLEAAEDKQFEVLEMLLRRGADVQAADKRGYSALSSVAEERFAAGAALTLLAAGADIEHKTIDGCTPLILAAGKGCDLVVQLLIRSRANVNATSDSGYTPLLGAARHGHFPVVTNLLREPTGSSIDVNASDHKGRTALALAIAKRESEREGAYTSVVDVLLGKNADVRKADLLGHTPLMQAVFVGAEDVFDKLLSKVQNIDVLDNEGFTALHHAAGHGQASMIKSLCEAGTSPLVESQAKSLPVDMLKDGDRCGDRFLRSYTNAAQLVETDGLRSILNGISIVVALIVTVTFIGLQTPPGGPSDAEGGQLKLAVESYADMQEHKTHPVRINRAALRAYLGLEGLSLFWAATDLLLVLAFLLPGVSKHFRRLDQAPGCGACLEAAACFWHWHW